MRWRLAIYSGICLVVLAFTFTTGARFDYVSYMAQWQAVLDGRDPWSDVSPHGVNAYGPLSVPLALLYAVHPLLPKVAMVGAYLAAALLFIASARSTCSTSTRREAGVALLLLANPLIVIFGYMFGANDILVAATVLMAMRGRLLGGRWSIAVWIALGTLLKFYPILFLPFLVMRDRRVDLVALVAAVAIVAAGFAASYAIWGAGTWSPIVFASDRGSSMLSIHYTLYHLSDYVGGIDFVELLRRRSWAIAGACGAIGLGATLLFRLPVAVGMAWTSLFVLLTYNVGHPQFYISWVAGSALLLVERGRLPHVSRIALLPVQALLALVAALYLFTYMRGVWLVFDHYLGLIALSIALVCCMTAVAIGLRDRRRASTA